MGFFALFELLLKGVNQLSKLAVATFYSFVEAHLGFLELVDLMVDLKSEVTLTVDFQVCLSELINVFGVCLSQLQDMGTFMKSLLG